MAERSFAKEVEKLRLGKGSTFRGEGILAVTKALLQSGVSYVGGYQGAPISHLMDVLMDANSILEELGVHFESSASEAAAAAMLAASVNYPLRGAVTWKSTVGTNVASDALANLASGGVKGGAIVIVGEDYGEGSSIMQERTHSFAMKSQMWLLDPEPNLPAIVSAVEHGFRLSEASNTPIFLELRVRACHLYGEFVAKDNVAPTFRLQDAMEAPQRDVTRIVLPPSSFQHEREKIERRLPAAIDYIRGQGLNETTAGSLEKIGIIMQGGMYNAVMRALHRLGRSDLFGRSEMPLYVLNVTYPLVPAEITEFCKGKEAVLVVEEGQPNYIEQNIQTILRQNDIETRLHGKDLLPMAGEYTAQVLDRGVADFIDRYDRHHAASRPVAAAAATPPGDFAALKDVVPPRPPSFCTGCPERPIFTSIKLVERELGPHHIAMDIGCHLFSILPPFNLGATTMGYGLGGASAAAFNVKSKRRTISVMGDGGFWHNGLNSGIANAVFNNSDNVFVIVDNGYAAATGGQDIPSSHSHRSLRNTNHSIGNAVRGVGVKWVREINKTYDLKEMTAALKSALVTTAEGPKVIVASSECMLNKQRRIRPLMEKSIAAGKRTVRERFGVDPDVCTGDHSCMRLSGCPSLTIRPNPNPLREDPIAHVESSCVGCGHCGEVAHAAILCPSFYRSRILSNPTLWERAGYRIRSGVIHAIQRFADRRLKRFGLEAALNQGS